MTIGEPDTVVRAAREQRRMRRDAGMARVRRMTRVVGAGGLILTALFAKVASGAFPGRSSHAQQAHAAATPKSATRATTPSQSGAGTSSGSAAATGSSSGQSSGAGSSATQSSGNAQSTSGQSSGSDQSGSGSSISPPAQAPAPSSGSGGGAVSGGS